MKNTKLVNPKDLKIDIKEEVWKENNRRRGYVATIIYGEDTFKITANAYARQELLHKLGKVLTAITYQAEVLQP